MIIPRPSFFIHRCLHAFIPVVVSVLLCTQTSAQFYGLPFRPKTDTLWEQVKHASGIEKTRLYNQLAFYHSFSTVDSAMWYANQALKLSREQGDRQAEANAIRITGHTLALDGNFRESIARLQQALGIYVDLGNKRGILEGKISLAKVNYDVGDFQRTSEYVDQIIPLFLIRFAGEYRFTMTRIAADIILVHP